MRWLHRIITSKPPADAGPILSTWEHLGEGTYLDRALYADRDLVLHFQLMLKLAEKTGREFYERE